MKLIEDLDPNVASILALVAMGCLIFILGELRKLRLRRRLRRAPLLRSAAPFRLLDQQRSIRVVQLPESTSPTDEPSTPPKRYDQAA